MLESYIELLRPKVIELFSKDLAGHSTDHLERAMTLALYLQEKEGGDRLIIGVASFLHDIHRVIQNEKGSYCSPKESLPKVEELLNEVDFPKEKIKEVLNAIQYHEEYYWNKTKEHNIETKILQDADNLDCVGALGVARIIQYFTSCNIPLYNSTIPLNKDDDYREEEQDPTIIHHFYHKLLKTDKTMNTKAATVLAEKRSKIAKDFTSKLMEEINVTDLI